MSSPCLFGEDVHDILYVGTDKTTGKEIAECGYCNKTWEVIRKKDGRIDLTEVKKDGKKV
jgi:hypothetical protein